MVTTSPWNRPARSITRADVARRAGTSLATVSYVLNDGPKRVSAAARPVRHAGTRPANLRASGHDHGFPSEPADGKGIPQPHEARSPRL